MEDFEPISFVEDEEGNLIEEQEISPVPKIEGSSQIVSFVEDGPTQVVAPKEEFTEEAFHVNTQSIADSRLLAGKTVEVPYHEMPPIMKQGHEAAVEILMGAPVPTYDDVMAAREANKQARPEFKNNYISSLNDGALTKETLDWLGVTRWNMVRLGELAFDVEDWSEEEQLALVRLMAQYEELPISWETTKRAAEGLATDPSSYVGLSFVLNTLAKVALKPAASNAVKEMMKKTGTVATVTGVETAAYTATDDLLNQKIMVDTGQQEGYNKGQTAAAAAVGFGAGFTIGGALAYGATKVASRKATPKTFSEMVEEQSNEAAEVVDEAAEVVDEASDEVVEVVEVVDDVADEADDFADEVSDEDYAEEFIDLDDEFADVFEDDFDMLAEMDSLADVTNDALPTVKAGDDVEVIVPVEAKAKPAKELEPTTVMPKNLRGAKPRYGFGERQYGIEFVSDVDKALYIISSEGSKSHDQYMAFLRGVFPDKTAREITLMGHEVKGRIKGKAKVNDANMDGNLVVDTIFEPTKKPRRAKRQAAADDPKPQRFSEDAVEEMPYNVMKMDTDRDVKSLVLQRASRYLEDNPRTPQTLDDVVEEGKQAAEDLARTTGGDADEIKKRLEGDIDELRAINARIKATRDLHVWAFDEMVRLAKKHGNDDITPQETAELAKVIELVNSLVPITMKQSAEQSRTLGSRRTMAVADNTLITGKIDGEDVKGAERITPQMDGELIKLTNNGDGKLVVQAAVDQILKGLKDGTLKSPRDLKKVISPNWLQKTIKEIQRVRGNSMLSGLSTLMMASLSNVYNAFAEPALHYIGFINLRLTKKARASVIEDALQRTHALAQYTGNIIYIKHGIKQALKAVWEGKHITDPNVTRLENMTAEGWAGKSKKRVGYELVTGWAHTTLLMLDELHKSTRAMALARADGIVAARREQLNALAAGKKAFKEGSEEWNKIVEKTIASKFDETGAVTDQAIKRQVQMETYTEELVGPVGNFFNGFARFGHGSGAFVLPFRRAPLNSVSYAVQYLTPPIPYSWIESKNLIPKQAEILKSGDPVQIAKLKARRKVGGMAIILAWALTDEERLTGAGPADYKLREKWIAAGNKPYSIKVMGEWIPYLKVEPFATMFGTVANLHAIVQMDPERYHKGSLELLLALQASIAETILDKASFSTFGDYMKLMTGEDNMTVRMAKSFLSSFVPNVTRQANDDPYVREANTAMEQIKSNVESYSKQLGAQYDIFGLPRLKPKNGWWLFKQPRTRADFDANYKRASQEIFDLSVLHDKEGILGKPPKNIGVGRANMQDVYDKGTEESVYAKYNRFIGEAEIGGKTLFEAIVEEIDSDEYKSRPKSVYLDVNSPHVARLSSIISKYRKKAKKRLMKESPAYRDAYTDYMRRSQEVKSAR